MTRRLRDASPGAILATIGVIDFASRLSRAPEQLVALPTSLRVGLISVVLVRLGLGMLVSGNVTLTVVGTVVGAFELVFLLRFHVSDSQSLATFIFCGLLDLFVMTSAYLALRFLRWARKRRPDIEARPNAR